MEELLQDCRIFGCGRILLSSKQAVGADMLQIGPGAWVLSAAFASEFHPADWRAVKVSSGSLQGSYCSRTVVGLVGQWCEERLHYNPTCRVFTQWSHFPAGEL